MELTFFVILAHRAPSGQFCDHGLSSNVSGGTNIDLLQLNALMALTILLALAVPWVCVPSNALIMPHKVNPVRNGIL